MEVDRELRRGFHGGGELYLQACQHSDAQISERNEVAMCEIR